MASTIGGEFRRFVGGSAAVGRSHRHQG